MIALRENSLISSGMRMRPLLPLVLFLPGGCIVGSIAKTAVDVVSIPVKVVGSGVDAVTTSQSEADEKRGRQLRKQDEARAREEHLAVERCRKGRPLRDDPCAAPAPH